MISRKGISLLTSLTITPYSLETRVFAPYFSLPTVEGREEEKEVFTKYNRKIKRTFSLLSFFLALLPPRPSSTSFSCSFFFLMKREKKLRKTHEKKGEKKTVFLKREKKRDRHERKRFFSSFPHLSFETFREFFCFLVPCYERSLCHQWRSIRNPNLESKSRNGLNEHNPKLILLAKSVVDVVRCVDKKISNCCRSYRAEIEERRKRG
jgi:hypothetical protein